METSTIAGGFATIGWRTAKWLNEAAIETVLGACAAAGLAVARDTARDGTLASADLEVVERDGRRWNTALENAALGSHFAARGGGASRMIASATLTLENDESAGTPLKRTSVSESGVNSTTWRRPA